MTTTRTVDQPPVKVEARQPLAALLRARELPVSVALIALIAITFALNPLFLSPQGVKDLLLNATIMMILAVGQAIVIITRNVDLSVGSMLGLVAFTVGTLFATQPAIPIWMVFVICIVMGAALGAVNGALVTLARVPALVITLGTLYVFRGVNNAWAGGKQYFAGDRPVEFGNLSVNTFLGLPWITIVAIVVIAAAGIALGRTRAGRDLYAIGSDPAAALMFGIPVRSRVFTAFVVNGALTGLAAVLYASRFNSVGATTGSGLELEVVAAAVVGGVAIFGGSGTPLGAAIGALLLTTITSSLTALRVDKFWQQAIVGVLILASVMVDRIVSLRNARKLRLSEARNG
jgi:rhamnose transport system permease protein